MRSWRIGRIADIDISVHWTFVLLLAWILFASMAQGTGAALLETGLVVALFGCVVLHELGHALAARIFGIPTHGITLLPIGGVAELERIPREPMKEWIIALAGPAVNVLIVGLLLPAVILADQIWGGAASAMGNGWFQRLIWMNVSLVVFNLIPAFPMDGGRLLRSALARRQPYVDATSNAVRVGRLVAGVLFLCGLVWNPMLMLVAGFIVLAGGAELGQVRREEQLRTESVFTKWSNAAWPDLPTAATGAAAGFEPRQVGTIQWTLPSGAVVVQAFHSPGNSGR